MMFYVVQAEWKRQQRFCSLSSLSPDEQETSHRVFTAVWGNAAEGLLVLLGLYGRVPPAPHISPFSGMCTCPRPLSGCQQPQVAVSNKMTF